MPWKLRMLAPRLGIFAEVSLLLCSCSSGSSAPPNTPEEQAQRPDAPLMAAQPGAWFDAEGSLTVVGAGRRLRLHLSAPITACSPAFEGPGTADQVAERASLSFRVLSEACRHDHPEILLPAEGETASPAERERSYREVARCASHDLGATSGWLPRAVAARDPCPVALGLGWRLPQVAELQGLGVDDRKAVAGALFDTEDRAGFGSLLLYAHDGGGKLTLVTLSPNAAEQAPSLNDDLAGKPFFGAALRCVRDTPPTPAGATPTPPPLPNASQCMRELRASQSKLRIAPQAQLPELQRLKAWLEQVERAPALLQSEASLRDLGALLATPSLERLAQEAREERALTERYAELAESLDAPDVSAAERERRRAEFDELRKRLGGKIVDSAVAGGGERPALSALLARSLQLLEEAAARATSGKPKAGKLKQPDYSAVIARLRALRGEKATTP